MWVHASTNDDIDVEAHQQCCEFCKTKLIQSKIDDRGPFEESVLRNNHDHHVRALALHVEDTYWSHLDVQSDFYLYDAEFLCCPVCGWWCILRQIVYSAPVPYSTHQWACGALARDKPPKIDTPVSEIRSYLCARYDQRFFVDPFRFEDVVASIFRSFGCTV